MSDAKAINGEVVLAALEALNKTTQLKCHSDRNPYSAVQNVYIVGTAHISKKSCNVVQNVIQTIKPDVFCLSFAFLINE